MAIASMVQAGAPTTKDGNVPTFHATVYLAAKTSNFGNLIEGAAVDKDGKFYAVHYDSRKQAVGRAFPSQELLFEDKANNNSWFNGIRFSIDDNKAPQAFLADVVNHRVVRLRTPGNYGSHPPMHSEVFCHDPSMLQPNDLAIAYSTGRVFLSGMKFTEHSVVGSGDLWTCDKRGVAVRLGLFHRTNGIEVSPDERTLYVSEAKDVDGTPVSNVIHAFDMDPSSGQVSNRRIFADFGKLDDTAANDVDGMRTDIEGNLYVSRAGMGKVAKLSPKGELIAYIQLQSIASVTSLELAGPQGRDLFAVGACKMDGSKGCIDKYTAPVVGRAFNALQARA